MATIEEGLRHASAGFYPDMPFLGDNHPAYRAFDMEVLDAAIAEVRDEVTGILRAAIERRLPWTWEPK